MVKYFLYYLYIKSNIGCSGIMYATESDLILLHVA